MDIENEPRRNRLRAEEQARTAWSAWIALALLAALAVASDARFESDRGGA